MKHKQLYGKDISESFRDFIKENPRFYELFERFALELIKAGNKVLSSYLICERIRWEYHIQTTDKNFKLNNSLRPHFGRLFMRRNPQYKGYFKTRKLFSEEGGPYMDVDENGQITFL